MSDVSVYEINNRQTWQKLLDKTETALSLPTALLNPDNMILQRSGERNELCNEIRSRKKALPAICGQSQQFMAKTARTKKMVVVEICEAGMAKFVVPVFHGKNYLGCITSCGCRLPETSIETYLIEKIADISADAVANMTENVPVVQKDKLRQVAESLFHRLNAS